MALAGCGGGGKGEPGRGQEVRTPRFTFVAPEGWHVERRPLSVVVRDGGGVELLSVTVSELRRAYDPELFAKVTIELDRLARTLAAHVKGVVRAGRTIVLAGRRVRQYDLAFVRNGTRLVDRMTFVLRRKTEYQLVCRLREGAGSDSGCDAFVESFRPATT